MPDPILFEIEKYDRSLEPLEKVKRPIIVAYGMGVDSTAMMMGLRDRGIRWDATVFADVGAEKDETYRYRRVMDSWLSRRGLPKTTVVRYRPVKFKNYPPYSNIEENCLSNGTLPSVTFGFGSCSLKWKAAPQLKWTQRWRPAVDTWMKGRRVVKLIGFDSSPGDIRRRNHAGTITDTKFEYRYPLQEWKWDRGACLERIIDERLPGMDPEYLNDAPLRWISSGGVPMKSSCFFCAAMKPWEVSILPKNMLKRIVILEARAKPRHRVIEGLWRKATKTRPGSMTEYILDRGLLPKDAVRRLQEDVPKELMNGVTKWRGTGEEINWSDFFSSVGVVPPEYCDPLEVT